MWPPSGGASRVPSRIYELSVSAYLRQLPQAEDQRHSLLTGAHDVAAKALDGRLRHDLDAGYGVLDVRGG